MHAFITSTGDIIGDIWKLFLYFETAISRHFFRKGLVELHCVGDCLKKCALISFCFGIQAEEACMHKFIFVISTRKLESTSCYKGIVLHEPIDKEVENHTTVNGWFKNTLKFQATKFDNIFLINMYTKG